MKFRVGEKMFKNFEVTDIKRGGLGIVYIVRDVESKKFYVWKSFQDRYFKDRRVVEDFHREAETWIKLRKHRNIVEALGVGQIEWKPYILLEYVDGGSLGQKIAGRRLDFAASLSYAIQFCDGMINAKYVELDGKEKGIVHRDIKPKNIMLTKEGTLKITDFGLVKALSAPSGERPAGTPEYMSPEQFETMDVDQRSDIYSFGIVLYEMLTGRMPFPNPSDQTLRFEHYKYCHQNVMITQPRKLEPALSKELEEVVLKCLKKNPGDRCQNFMELRNKLMDIYLRHCRIPPEARKKKEPLTAAEWFLKGYSLLALDRFTEAIECLDRALELNPRFAPAWSYKGCTLLKLGRYDEALPCLDRALEIGFMYEENKWAQDSSYANTWLYKGAALLKLDRFDDAIECFNKALELNPIYADAWTGKGAALLELDRPDEALVCCDKALEINPNFKQALNLKERILLTKFMQD